MAEYIATSEELKGIADTIRAKGGTTAQLKYPDGFNTAINGIDTAKPEQEKTISVTDNGAAVVTPDNGKVLSKATVDVNVPKKKPEETKTVKYTTNGTKTVTPTAGKVMTSVSVEVAVPTPAPVIQPLLVTANGTYTAPSGTDGYSPITVNCPAPKPEQSKTVEITANGDTTITPDVGKVLSSVIAKVNVPTGGGGGDMQATYGEFTLDTLTSSYTFQHGLPQKPHFIFVGAKKEAYQLNSVPKYSFAYRFYLALNKWINIYDNSFYINKKGDKTIVERNSKHLTSFMGFSITDTQVTITTDNYDANTATPINFAVGKPYYWVCVTGIY